MVDFIPNVSGNKILFFFCYMLYSFLLLSNVYVFELLESRLEFSVILLNCIISFNLILADEIFGSVKFVYIVCSYLMPYNGSKTYCYFWLVGKYYSCGGRNFAYLLPGGIFPPHEGIKFLMQENLFLHKEKKFFRGEDMLNFFLRRNKLFPSIFTELKLL